LCRSYCKTTNFLETRDVKLKSEIKLKNQLEKTIESMAVDVESVFEDVKSSSFSADTIAALSRFHDGMVEINLECHTWKSEEGMIGISEDEVHFQIHESDNNYVFCTTCRTITKYSHELVSIV
jgi:hypothetical protein